MSDSVHAVVDAMSARLDAELPLSNLAVKFTVFDLSRWYSAWAEARRRGEDDADSPFSMTALTFLVKGLFSDWQLDARAGVQEFTGAVHKLLRKEDIHLSGGKPRDNRVVWSRVLHESDFGQLSVLPSLVRVYLAAMEGTCGIERDLSSLTRVLGAHVGPLDEDGHTAACLTEILLDASRRNPRPRRGREWHGVFLAPHGVHARRHATVGGLARTVLCSATLRHEAEEEGVTISAPSRHFTVSVCANCQGDGCAGAERFSFGWCR